MSRLVVAHAISASVFCHAPVTCGRLAFACVSRPQSQRLALSSFNVPISLQPANRPPAKINMLVHKEACQAHRARQCVCVWHVVTGTAYENRLDSLMAKSPVAAMARWVADGRISLAKGAAAGMEDARCQREVRAARDLGMHDLLKGMNGPYQGLDPTPAQSHLRDNRRYLKALWTRKNSGQNKRARWSLAQCESEFETPQRAARVPEAVVLEILAESMGQRRAPQGGRRTSIQPSNLAALADAVGGSSSHAAPGDQAAEGPGFVAAVAAPLAQNSVGK